MRLSTVQVGYGKLRGLPAQGEVSIFARDEHCLAAARFVALGGGAVAVPANLLHSVDGEGIVTQHLVVRGHFQTLTIRATGVLLVADLAPSRWHKK